MKILFLNRAKNFGFSFETLFKSIKESMVGCEVVDYYDKTHASFWKNLKEVKKINADIIHITGGIGYYALFLPTKKTILTIHDTNHYEFDLTGIKKWLFGLIYYRLPIANVNKVTVVSEHTKKNLIRFFNIAPSKIEVIPNCYPNEFKLLDSAKPSEQPTILQIGTKKNKNLKGLIEAVKDLSVHVIIVGKLSEPALEQLKKANIEYTHKTDLSVEEIMNEYKKADLVYFCSFCEGFGLPLIEANALGRPVITSKLSPMTEVAGDAAHFVDPHNTAEIREGIQLILNDDTYRQGLINKGLENAKNYTSQHIANLYLTLYKSLGNG